MAELKTKPTKASVKAFLDGVENERRRADARELATLMKKVTGARPVMWGESIVGYGRERLKYETGRELDWFVLGFSPRKANLAIYGTNSAPDQAKLLAKLGKHKKGAGCLYVNKLDDVDRDVLEQLLRSAVSRPSD